DWPVFAASHRGRAQSLFRDVLKEAGATATEAATGARLTGADPAERVRILQEIVLGAVAKVLKTAASRIDPRRSLGEMGLSSLMAMELRNRLEAALGRG